MKPRRYQLSKDSTAIIARGHPWIFRDQLSSAASVLRDGDLVRLVDGANAVVAHGIFESEGAIAIRIIRRGPARPDAAWLTETLVASFGRRGALVARTDGIRLLHGESDHLPAVVADRFGDTIVVASYAAGADAYARYAASYLISAVSGVVGTPANIVVRSAHRRQLESAPEPAPPRVVRGVLPEVAGFVEDGLRYAVDLVDGQKTGAYLDLRGLRAALAAAPLAGARVLNLFAYTGMLGRAAEQAGAANIIQVDRSERALAFARAHHVTDPAKHEFITADIFAWLPSFDREALFDLVIVDPPAMTSRKTQVPAVLAGYRKLYRAAREHVRPGGVVVAACCTSRVDRAVFHRTVGESLGGEFAMERELPAEIDHPIGFPQADYLKIGWWRRA